MEERIKKIRKEFQSTPLREGRLVWQQYSTDERCFNPRPSVRGDPVRGLHGHAARRFNPRPSVRGDSAQKVKQDKGFLFQSTPLREGRLQCAGVLAQAHRVSIHAPP